MDYKQPHNMRDFTTELIWLLRAMPIAFRTVITGDFRKLYRHVVNG